METIDPDSSSDDDCQVTLSASECQSLVEQFASVTNTDEALAQFFLQQNEWKLELALNAFYNHNSTQSSESRPKSTVEITTIESSDDDAAADDEVQISPQKKRRSEASNDAESVQRMTTTVTKTGGETEAMSKADPVLKFITWNIDGLSQANLHLRATAVCNIIKEIEADVVFLQEVVIGNEKVLKSQLESEYVYLASELNPISLSYYTVTLLKKSTIKLLGSEIIEYKQTSMARNLFKVEAEWRGISIVFLNTHLESTKQASSIRQQQLKEIFDIIKAIPKQRPVIMAGDLNIRDYELHSVGGLPSGFVDVWAASGGRKECEYTWDMRRNDNLGDMSYMKSARLRFDRVYFKDSIPPHLNTKYFGLIGIERLKPHKCFPSDHWGILATFTYEN